MQSIKTIALLLLLLALLAHSKRTEKCKKVNCPKGYRCHEGTCRKQEHEARKNLCLIDDTVKQIKCKKRDAPCLVSTQVLTCGYTKQGLKMDFKDECSPCRNEEVQYYFQLACVDAPPVCGEEEDCVNGVCFALFNDEDHADDVACNSSSQCQPFEMCVANKCVRKTDVYREFKSKEKQLDRRRK
jgi:hypothetical protein